MNDFELITAVVWMIILALIITYTSDMDGDESEG